MTNDENNLGAAKTKKLSSTQTQTQRLLLRVSGRNKTLTICMFHLDGCILIHEKRHNDVCVRYADSIRL